MANVDSYARLLALAVKGELNKLESEVVAKLTGLVYKGTVNSVEDLNSKTIGNGFMYRSTFNGTYNGQEVKSGDVFIGLIDDTGSKWELTPAEVDEDAVYITDALEIQGGSASE